MCWWLHHNKKKPEEDSIQERTPASSAPLSCHRRLPRQLTSSGFIKNHLWPHFDYACMKRESYYDSIALKLRTLRLKTPRLCRIPVFQEGWVLQVKFPCHTNQRISRHRAQAATEKPTAHQRSPSLLRKKDVKWLQTSCSADLADLPWAYAMLRGGRGRGCCGAERVAESLG